MSQILEDKNFYEFRGISLIFYTEVHFIIDLDIIDYCDIEHLSIMQDFCVGFFPTNL